VFARINIKLIGCNQVYFQRDAQERRNVVSFDFKENQICILTIFPNY